MQAGEQAVYMNCDTCALYAFDEDDQEYYCTADMDEDDAAALAMGQYKDCPFWQNGDEYRVVRHQM